MQTHLVTFHIPPGTSKKFNYQGYTYSMKVHTWKYLMSFVLDRFSQTRLIHVANMIGYKAQQKNDLIKEIIQKPGPFLVQLGVFDYPEFIVNTIIKDFSGVKYMITDLSSFQIQNHDQFITLLRMKDKQEVSLAYANIRKWISSFDGIFDQSKQLVT